MRNVRLRSGSLSLSRSLFSSRSRSGKKTASTSSRRSKFFSSEKCFWYSGEIAPASALPKDLRQQWSRRLFVWRGKGGRRDVPQERVSVLANGGGCGRDWRGLWKSHIRTPSRGVLGKKAPRRGSKGGGLQQSLVLCVEGHRAALSFEL